MHAKNFLSGTILVSCFLLCAATSGGVPGNQNPESARLAVRELQSTFHEAVTCADYDLLFDLWAEDAVWSSPAGTFVGPTEIANFFASGPNWGRVTSLSSNYKALSTIRGNTADFAFECILVDVSGEDPLTTCLSSVPFGAQNPDVEIVQHSNAFCTAIRRGNRWKFQSFTGAAGPIIF
jgi:ketosteroid isomerase-like protein